MYKNFTLFFTLIIVVFLTRGTVLAQSKNGSVSGSVKTSDGNPAAFVSVGIKNTSKTAQSDESGNFTIKNVAPGNYTLKVSAVGVSAQEKQVSVTAGETATVSFSIAESSSQLKEVAINGYRTPNTKPVNLGKIAIAPRDLPQAVQIIGTQVIADQQVNSLGDVMKNINGVALGANRGSVGENFYARGYSLGSNNVFKNGARTTIGGSPEASTLESVEVLKGSAALLYGGVSGGAVVNMVTKKPKFEYGGEVSMRVGSYDLYKPIVDLYGPISDKIAFRVIGTYESAGSYRDNVSSKRFYVNPSLLYKINDKTEVIVQGDYLKSNFTPDFGIGTIGNKLSPLGRNVFINTAWAYNKTNTATAQAAINHKFNADWKLNFSASLQSYNRDYFSAERPAASATGVWNRALTRSDIEEFTFNQQINLTGAFKTGSIKHILLIGADADQASTKSGGFSPTAILPAGNNPTYYDTVNLLDPLSFDKPSNYNMPATTLLTNTDASVFRMGGFVQDLVSLTEQFKVLAGIRWSFQKTPTTDITTIASGGVTKGTATDKIDKAFSPKFGIIYEPLKNTSVYVSYSNNFTSNTGIDIETNGPMGPSIIDQYEAGVKNDFLEGKLSANLTVYRIKNDKFAQTALADPTKREFSGATASDGIELDLSGTIVSGLNFLAGYSYNYMRYTSTIATGIVEGERVVGTTKNTANATLFYTFQNGDLKGLKLGASAFYTGDRNGGRNTTKNNSSTGIIPLSAFTTLDFSAGYSWKKFSLLAKISNITNELNYFVHENYSVNPIAPRQFLTTLSYKF
jgi:iron complex outermembrane receptor protein